MTTSTSRGSLAPGSLSEILRLFLRLGLTAFGGPAAHLTLMQRETVDRRGWLTREQFLDLVGACNLLPGPSSTQVAMALGFVRGGWAGLLLAGLCFILPAAAATMALAWAYVRFGALGPVQAILAGAKPVMVAIVAQAVWRLGRTAWRRLPLALLGLLCLAASLLGAPALAVLLAGGGAALLKAQVGRNRAAGAMMAALPASAATAVPVLTLGSLALVFLKMGVVVFGSGYVLLAFLQAELVQRLHWVTAAQLLDAVTAGQLTPGPVFATATFLGFLLHGFAGAAVATAAIFLPSFAMAGLVAAAAGRLRRSPAAAAFLDGINAAAVALMAAVGLTLARAALVDPLTCVIAAVSAALLLATRLNATWLLAAGALAGLLLH